MICVSRELGENIAKYRKQAAITQQQLADEVSRLTGRQISLHMVSAWERGQRDVPAALIPPLCHIVHCTSWDLYPHSEAFTDRDVRLLATITALADEEKDALYYLLHQWRGNREALIKLAVIHAVQDESMRYVADRAIIDSYIDAKKHASRGLDKRAKTDLPYVLKAWKHLLEDDEGEKEA